jgi:hypothetical protein
MLIVTATELPRLMACNGSRTMKPLPVQSDDTVRNEGNAADWLVKEFFKSEQDIEEFVDRKAPNGVYITAEMVEHLEPYLKNVVGGDIEVETSYGGDNWRVNGRADLIKYDHIDHLQVGDLKYGWSIVEPEKNWTLISHAIGYAERTGHMPFIKTVTFTIYQPRPHHPAGRIRNWTITGEELLDYRQEINRVLSNPTNQLNTGVHCNNCPALAFCPAARKAAMNAIDTSEIAFNDELDNNALSFHLDQFSRGIKVLEQLEKAYSELAFHRVKDGQIVPNYTIENELTNRQWRDYVTTDTVLSLSGVDASVKKLITPAQAEKAGVSKEVVDALTERRQKGFRLIRVDANKNASKHLKKGN